MEDEALSQTFSGEDFSCVHWQKRRFSGCLFAGCDFSDALLEGLPVRRLPLPRLPFSRHAVPPVRGGEQRLPLRQPVRRFV